MYCVDARQPDLDLAREGMEAGIGSGDTAYVMVPVEEGEQDADRGREQQQTVLGESVGDEKAAPIPDADLVLGLLVVSVQGREIDVGGRVVDVDVLVGGAEDTGSRGMSISAVTRYALCRHVLEGGTLTCGLRVRRTRTSS